MKILYLRKQMHVMMLPTVVLICCLFFINASANEVAQTVESTVAAIKEILAKKNSEEAKKSEVLSIIDKQVDIKWLSGFILGKNNSQLNSEQHKQFIHGYKNFALNLYYSSLGYISDKELKITSTSERSNNRFSVIGFVLSKDGSKVPFEVRLHKADGMLLIYDVITSGISLALSQRNEVDSVIKNKGIDGLLDTIK
ncbi:phospholipid transport system substrate-binding protein [Candidatus Xenohaliotis californiensis]|uniref:Phospholipid transport system substrate-binding protein n=1 Tax=Candidatus Xenohaliotis californiensis TaxID=84677 RepID=A0ABP0ESY1_9RICK|nr:phospholipid transport system substrate-binding protein [Candidatus Xenohaliotis californiensis]